MYVYVHVHVQEPEKAERRFLGVFFEQIERPAS